MSTVGETTETTVAHLSYSQLDTFRHCAKAYELSRVLKLPETPGIARAAGVAVHKAIERYNLHTL